MPSVLGRATNNALGSLEHWWETPVDRRYNILPLAEQPDGSTVPAVPGLIAEPFNALARVMANAGRRETTYDDSGTAINGPGALAPGDGLNAVGLAPLGTMALGTAARAVPRGALGAGPVRPDLPMDLASRMARAKEMGFDTDNPLYKGYYPYRSGGPITNVRGEVVREEPYVLKDELSGFFSRNPEVANRFSGVYADEQGNYRQLFDNNAVAKVFSRASNPLVIDADGNYAASVQFENIAKRDGTTDKYNQWKNAKADGYDSVLIKNTRDEGDIVQVFDPRNIRSVNAAFDPAMADSANLLAANPESSSSVPLALSMAQAERPTYTGPGITAYHGSPHDFDRFDLSKIGTGEGAQAYGHGLYFAENEGVAKSYRDQLGTYDNAVTWKGHGDPSPAEQKVISRLSGFDVARNEAASLDSVEREIRQAIVRERLNEGAPGWNETRSNQRIADLKEQLAAVRGLADKVDIKPPGRMYQVRINADPESFLDWDKPLSQQSDAVRSSINNALQRPEYDLFRQYHEGSRWGGIEALKGSQLHEVLIDPEGFGSLGNKADAMSRMREQGIPGIRYLDQGSRSAGDGSRNYVLFDDSLIDILKKYANAPTGSMAPLALSQDGEDGVDINDILRRYGMIP